MEAKTKMTQRDIILWHLQNIGTLTRAQAMSEYGIVELPARIVELKRLGYNITSEKGTSTLRRNLSRIRLRHILHRVVRILRKFRAMSRYRSER